MCWLLAVRGWLVTGLRGAGRLGEAARGVRFPSRAAFVDARLLPCIADGERQGRPPEREKSQRQSESKDERRMTKGKEKEERPNCRHSSWRHLPRPHSNRESHPLCALQPC